jgi:hypothetical protein
VSTEIDKVESVLKMLPELHRLSRAAEADMLAYLLELAIVEANDILQQGGGRRGGYGDTCADDQD